MHAAAVKGQGAAVELLLDWNCDPNIRDKVRLLVNSECNIHEMMSNSSLDYPTLNISTIFKFITLWRPYSSRYILVIDRCHREKYSRFHCI